MDLEINDIPMEGRTPYAPTIDFGENVGTC